MNGATQIFWITFKSWLVLNLIVPLKGKYEVDIRKYAANGSKYEVHAYVINIDISRGI